MAHFGSQSRLLTVLIISLCLSACAHIKNEPMPAASSGLHSLVLANTQSLYYRSAGNEHSSTPILLIHGIPDASDSWLPIMARLAQTNPVYAVDLAGYGYSDWPYGYDLSLSAQVEYLTAFLDQRHLTKVIVAGHDIGGGIATLLAVRHPERVAQLILINSVIGDHWPVFEMHLLRTPVLGSTAFALLETPTWYYMLHKGFYRDELLTDTTVQRYRQWYTGAAGRRRLIHNARALDNTELAKVSRHPAALTTTTLILWGRHDRFLAAAPAQQLCAAMPHCQFIAIEDAGHFVLDEQPELIAEQILNFITPN